MKKKLIHRIGAFVCALVMAVSVFGASMPYYASSSGAEYVRSLLISLGYNCPELPSNYDYMLLQEGDKVWLRGIKTPHDLIGFIRLKEDISSNKSVGVCTRGWFEEGYDSDTYYEYLGLGNNFDMVKYYGPYSGDTAQEMYFSSIDNLVVLYSDFDIYWCSRLNPDRSGIWYEASIKEPIYNSNLGYLQNISRKQTYIRGALYNYDEESLTYHWYHDTTSSSGVDLASGNYAVRHYVSMATVTGYEQEDIVEMSDKYLMAEFDASQGYYSYLVKDYDEKLETLGYEGLGFVDKYLKGYFLLEHHYFQIVNLDTNEVGGYVHLYPKDSTGEFGVELNYEGLDENFDVDPEAPSGVADDSTGSGLTEDEALENADEPKLDDIEGVEPFIDTLESYSLQINGVSSGIGAFIQAFPPWIIGTFAIAFGLMVLGIVIKVLRG